MFDYPIIVVCNVYVSRVSTRYSIATVMDIGEVDQSIKLAITNNRTAIITCAPRNEVGASTETILHVPRAILAVDDGYVTRKKFSGSMHLKTFEYFKSFIIRRVKGVLPIEVIPNQKFGSSIQ